MRAPRDPINLAEKLASFSEAWSPRVAARVNDHEVRLAHLDQREFPWHHHDETDEMFFCLAGSFAIEFRTHSVRLVPGELVVVPRGVEHRPVAEGPAQAMIVERSGTLNTGNTRGVMTVEQLREI